MAQVGPGITAGLAESPPPPELTVSASSFLKPLSELIGEKDLEPFLVACTRAISPFYAHAQVRLRAMSVDKTFPLMRKVEQRRLKRARALLKSMRARRVAPYCPIALGDSKHLGIWLIYPPLVEPQARRTYVINGHHRLIAAREANIRRVQVLTVDRVDTPAPAAPTRWTDVVATRSTDVRSAAIDLEEGLIRPSASFCRSRYFYFESEDRLAEWCRWLVRNPHQVWNPETRRLDPAGDAPNSGQP
jgi:hypothetical protein